MLQSIARKSSCSFYCLGSVSSHDLASYKLESMLTLPEQQLLRRLEPNRTEKKLPSNTLISIPLSIICSLNPALSEYRYLHFGDQKASSHVSSRQISLYLPALRWHFKRLHLVPLQFPHRRVLPTHSRPTQPPPSLYPVREPPV